MMSESDTHETEAHATRVKFAPVEVEAHASKIRFSPETEAHGFKARDVPETEAHGYRRGWSNEETETHAHLVLRFPPDAEAQTIELRYRPPATEGERPEIELHALRHSDVRLKRAIRTV